MSTHNDTQYFLSAQYVNRTLSLHVQCLKTLLKLDFHSHVFLTQTPEKEPGYGELCVKFHEGILHQHQILQAVLCRTSLLCKQMVHCFITYYIISTPVIFAYRINQPLNQNITFLWFITPIYQPIIHYICLLIFHG